MFWKRKFIRETQALAAIYNTPFASTMTPIEFMAHLIRTNRNLQNSNNSLRGKLRHAQNANDLLDGKIDTIERSYTETFGLTNTLPVAKDLCKQLGISEKGNVIWIVKAMRSLHTAAKEKYADPK